mmetsp:Transcript_18372/g.20422  ORF Transcript_18372/g.20422 Transcript_18372/m.20422 type:complete len:95 (+) Transcript_18372:75-359(+)
MIKAGGNHDPVETGIGFGHVKSRCHDFYRDWMKCMETTPQELLCTDFMLDYRLCTQPGMRLVRKLDIFQAKEQRLKEGNLTGLHIPYSQGEKHE